MAAPDPSTKGESDALSSSKRIISHPAFVDAQRFGKRAVHTVLAASLASHDSTHALIFNVNRCLPGSWEYSERYKYRYSLFQNREAQSEMPQISGHP